MNVFTCRSNLRGEDKKNPKFNFRKRRIKNLKKITETKHN